MTDYTYTAYGLTICTPFPCPILPSAPTGAPPDIFVSFGKVPHCLPAAVTGDTWWEIAPCQLLSRGGKYAGNFLAVNGERVIVERNPATEEHMLAIHFLNSVLAALLRQRGMLVLHGNAVITPTGTVVVSGESGTGKSTTLAALLKRGCTMLTDDITALKLDANGEVIAPPGIPQLHLTEDAAAGLGQDISGLPRYPWKRMKAPVPTAGMMATKPALLDTIYLLDFHDGDGIQLNPLTGGEKFAALQKCVYGPVLPDEHPNLFPLFSAVVEQTAIYRLNRPPHRWTVNEIADLILST